MCPLLPFKSFIHIQSLTIKFESQFAPLSVILADMIENDNNIKYDLCGFIMSGWCSKTVRLLVQRTTVFWSLYLTSPVTV